MAKKYGTFSLVKVLATNFIVASIIALTIRETHNAFNSLSLFSSVLLFIITFLSFYNKSKEKQNEKAKYWPLFAMIVGGVYGFMAWVFAFNFLKTITYDSSILGIILFSLFVAVLSYFSVISIEVFNRRILLFVTMIFFVTGLTTAISHTKDHYWWKSSICSLGMPFNGTPFFYNYTLIMTGLLLSLFFIYLKTDFVRLVDKNLLTRKQLKLSAINYFTVIAFIILVGALPYGYNTTFNDIHVRAAQMAYVFFGVFIFFIHQLMPIFSKKFEIFSYLTLGIGLFLYILFNPFAFYSMATFEIITIIMMAFWFSFFIKNVDIAKE